MFVQILSGRSGNKSLLKDLSIFILGGMILSSATLDVAVRVEMIMG